MTDLSFVCGQVRAQESKLFTVNHLDRMIGAKNLNDAFTVFVELNYAEYIDESTQAYEFGKIIDQGLLETKQLLMSGSDAAQALNFLWYRFDLNNLKRVLKLKFKEGATSIEDFSEENGFSLLGALSKQALEALVFKGDVLDGFPEAFTSVVLNAEDVLESHEQSFRFLEFALDQAYFLALANQLEYSASYYGSDEFLGRLQILMIDLANFRSIARSVLVAKETLPEEAWILGGSLFYAEVADFSTFSDLQKWGKNTRFESCFEDINDGGDDMDMLSFLEKRLDVFYVSFLDDASLGEVASIQVPLVYFERRLQNARLLKFVMFAKSHGLSPEKIYEALEKL